MRFGCFGQVRCERARVVPHITLNRRIVDGVVRMHGPGPGSAGHDGEPRTSVSRSIFPIVSDLDRAYFGHETTGQDQVGFLDGGTARFGKSYAGEPDQLVKELAEDEAVAAADTLLLTIPNQLGVDYNAHVLESVLTHLAPELGWR